MPFIALLYFHTFCLHADAYYADTFFRFALTFTLFHTLIFFSPPPLMPITLPR